MNAGGDSVGIMLNLSARGFCVEWMAAVTVLVCGISKEFAIPVSTTHCQVGSMFSFLSEILFNMKNTKPKKTFAEKKMCSQSRNTSCPYRNA